ncbi:LacI family DNA-binding transcriptional regulator [Paenibacillus sp. FSL W8-1187]|uniref:LacI family DNA-binding transcriptional regulator n=1 Tax=Paenibacillus sp. FSL W8-1187 TaxID=2975339 RepID=UPI0030DB0190
MAKLKDIAERLGVSISTVSRAISGDRTRPVSEETKRRVLDAARELGYPLQGDRLMRQERIASSWPASCRAA